MNYDCDDNIILIDNIDNQLWQTVFFRNHIYTNASSGKEEIFNFTYDVFLH